MKNHISLLTHGAKIAGAAVGGAAGSLAGPAGTVAGAAIGAAVAETCTKVLDDLAKRWLSPKEEQRVAGVAVLAIEKIREKLLFETVRNDDFFEGDDSSPSAAAELFEGLLLSAKQEHEQLKLPYMANFYANLVFDKSVKRSEANYLLGVAETLTYTQLCMLGLRSKLQSGEYVVRTHNLNSGEMVSEETQNLAEQAEYLKQRQLFQKLSPFQADITFNEATTLPSATNLSTTGQRLSNLMELHLIERDDLEALAKNW
ncbi:MULTISPECIES: hypothetical protein [Pseudomonas]|uniref:hypothetical protein n=1 Tax=Pseudomonas TaxID=286 RepID=UPI00035CE283|nr:MULTISPECIES: hypothetical protein [Pseudomonas]